MSWNGKQVPDVDSNKQKERKHSEHKCSKSKASGGGEGRKNPQKSVLFLSGKTIKLRIFIKAAKK